MNSYQKDKYEKDVLLSKDNYQVMMEWEKPYMEKSIEFLEPFGDVLEIGFGLGYSASKIMKYPIKSYTIIECDPNVIKQIKIWRKKYNTKINIIEGMWQEKLGSLKEFDCIYFDDYPLEINEKTDKITKGLSNKRLLLFIDLCIQNHTKKGSKISFYLNENNKITLSSDSTPFVKIEYKSINIDIPENCEYRDTKVQKCLIPVITKVKEYSFEEANRLAMIEISKKLKF